MVPALAGAVAWILGLTGTGLVISRSRGPGGVPTPPVPDEAPDADKLQLPPDQQPEPEPEPEDVRCIKWIPTYKAGDNAKVEAFMLQSLETYIKAADAKALQVGDQKYDGPPNDEEEWRYWLAAVYWTDALSAVGFGGLKDALKFNTLPPAGCTFNANNPAEAELLYQANLAYDLLFPGEINEGP